MRGFRGSGRWIAGSLRVAGCLVCFLGFPGAAPVAQAQDITSNLVGRWKLDETSGTAAGDSV